MTTMKSVTGSHELAVSVGTPSHGTYLRLGNLRTGADGMSASFPTADLLAALNAVPAEKLAEAESELAKLRVVDSDGQDLFDRAVSRADRLEAERDALTATVARVREALSRHPEPCAETEFTCGWKGAVVDLLAALDPKPAFTLPTEAGAGIIATDSGPRCYEREYRLFADGMWHGADGSILHPKTLMANYIGHRLTEDVA